MSAPAPEKLYHEAMELAVATILDRYGVEQALEIHLAMDGDPEDALYNVLTEKLRILSPESFGCDGGEEL